MITVRYVSRKWKKKEKEKQKTTTESSKQVYYIFHNTDLFSFFFKRKTILQEL